MATAKWEHIFQYVSDGPQIGKGNMVYCVSLNALTGFYIQYILKTYHQRLSPKV